MVQIQNKDATDLLWKAAKVPNSETYLIELGKTAVPVVDMTPDFHTNNIILQQSYTATQTNATVLTTDATKLTYLSGIYLQNQSDVTADNTAITVTGTLISGLARTFIRFNKLSTTVYNANQFIPFQNPMLLAKNSTLLFTNAFTVGASTTIVIVQYYEVQE